MSNLSVLERCRIVTMWEQGYNKTDIATELNVSRRTVIKWVRRHEDEGNVDTRGRPPKPKIIDAERMEQMRDVYSRHPFTPTREFAHQFDCSMETVRKALHRLGMQHRIPAKKICLTDDHSITARLRKKVKMTDKPKRPMSAYMLWLNSAREKIKSEHPGLKITEIAKKGGEIWRGMKDKSVWEEKSAKAKEQYRKDLESYNANGGGGEGGGIKKAQKRGKNAAAPKTKKKEESEDEDGDDDDEEEEESE